MAGWPAWPTERSLSQMLFSAIQHEVNSLASGIHWPINDEMEEHHEKDDSFAGSGRTDADRICGESLGVFRGRQ